MVEVGVVGVRFLGVWVGGDGSVIGRSGGGAGDAGGSGNVAITM